MFVPSIYVKKREGEEIFFGNLFLVFFQSVFNGGFLKEQKKEYRGCERRNNSSSRSSSGEGFFL